MFDFKFDWSNDINTNISIIDDQHKELFRIGREIEQLIITECKSIELQDLINLVGELRDFVSYHFYEEEQLMLKYNYKGFKSHKKAHDAFKSGILEIDFKVIDDSTCKKLNELKTFIQDWIFHHMITEDQIMADSLKK